MALSDLAVRSLLTRSGPSDPPVPSGPWAYLLTRKRPRAALRSLEARVRGGWLSADPGALTAVLLALLNDPSRPPPRGPEVLPDLSGDGLDESKTGPGGSSGECPGKRGEDDEYDL